MHEVDGHGAAGWMERMDRASRLRLRAFVFKLLLMIPISVAFAAQGHTRVLAAICYFCFWYGAFSGVAAMAQRHRISAIFLTAWDEMAAFLGIAVIARLLDSLVS
jgi:hypothetical protein